MSCCCKCVKYGSTSQMETGFLPAAPSRSRLYSVERIFASQMMWIDSLPICDGSSGKLRQYPLHMKFIKLFSNESLSWDIISNLHFVPDDRQKMLTKKCRSSWVTEKICVFSNLDITTEKQKDCNRCFDSSSLCFTNCTSDFWIWFGSNEGDQYSPTHIFVQKMFVWLQLEMRLG